MLADSFVFEQTRISRASTVAEGAFTPQGGARRAVGAARRWASRRRLRKDETVRQPPMYYRFKQFTLLLGDLVCLYLGLYLALVLRYWNCGAPSLDKLLAPMTGLFLLAVVVAFIVGLYDLGQARNSWSFFQKIIITAGIWVALGIIYFYLKPRNDTSPKTILALCAVCGFGLISIWRWLHNHFLSATMLTTRVAFVGLTDETAELIKILESEPERGYTVAGLVVENPEMLSAEKFAGLKKYAMDKNSLVSNEGKSSAEIIVIAPSSSHNLALIKELYAGLFRQVGVIGLEKFYERILGRIPPFIFSESWFLSNLQEQEKKIYDRGRIIFDYLCAILMGLFFCLTFPLIALVIKINSIGPIFFVQERVGRNGKIFKLRKYRTMKALDKNGGAEIDGPRWADANDSRITGVGRFLRKTRLDELPQFVNILKGEMALIGPRPERPEFVAALTEKMPFYALRHLVKPGLTGWAQLQKSYYGSLEENLRKLEYDLYYLKRRGPILDMIIFLRTFNIVGRMGGR